MSQLPNSNKRLSHLLSQLSPQPVAGKAKEDESKKENKDSVTVVDNRNGNKVTLPIEHGGFVPAEGLWKLKLRSYDPGYFNTASAKSSITYIDGDKGVLEYRGYPIEELAEKSSFLEVAYLLLYGELPTREQYDYFQGRVMKHTFIHEDVAQIMKSFRYDAHPMGMLTTTIAALGNVAFFF
ncbi:citrate synthase [Reticulomyxa filosa]|uniref:Citrate synthase n=1 Tax=Reticulomyxa filosa TaxID=46433 RepID=X6NP23_RETFI|nr:citrate synthase [Reticulomyxa filosa]|eukprot:ETO27122.1 citrate synthase [Reticulomyxa filosa]